MPFVLTELVVESIIRDGLADIRKSIGTDKDQIKDIFATLALPYLEKEYGQQEIQDISDMVLETPPNPPIEIVQGFPNEQAHTRQISINLERDGESEQHASLDDFVEEDDIAIPPTILIPTFNADSYAPLTGVVAVNGANLNLSNIQTGSIFVDGGGFYYPIIGGITNTNGDKRFSIARGQTPNLTGCKIISPLASKRSIIRGIRCNENVVLTVLTEVPLMTKYLYTIVKYIVASRKTDFMARGLDIDTFDGSDFHRASHLPANPYQRYLVLRPRFIEHTWVAENVTLLGQVNAAIKVKRDLYRRDDEDLMTVQTIIDN